MLGVLAYLMFVFLISTLLGTMNIHTDPAQEFVIGAGVMLVFLLFDWIKAS